MKSHASRKHFYVLQLSLRLRTRLAGTQSGVERRGMGVAKRLARGGEDALRRAKMKESSSSVSWGSSSLHLPLAHSSHTKHTSRPHLERKITLHADGVRVVEDGLAQNAKRASGFVGLVVLEDGRVADQNIQLALSARDRRFGHLVRSSIIDCVPTGRQFDNSTTCLNRSTPSSTEWTLWF